MRQKYVRQADSIEREAKQNEKKVRREQLLKMDKLYEKTIETKIHTHDFKIYMIYYNTFEAPKNFLELFQTYFI